MNHTYFRNKPELIDEVFLFSIHNINHFSVSKGQKCQWPIMEVCERKRWY